MTRPQWTLVQAYSARHGRIRVDAISMRRIRWRSPLRSSVIQDEEAYTELAASEERLRQIIKHSPQAIAVFDRQLRYLMHSDRWIEDYKLTDQNLTGKYHYDVFPELPERWKEAHRRCLAGAVERAEEDCFERTDGRLEWVRWEVRPWREATGEIGGVVMLTEVITARKALEEQLRQAQKMEAIGRLAGGVAHDFNNLLTIIQTFGGFVLEALPEWNPARADMSEVLGAAKRAESLTQQLLTFSRQRTVRPRIINLNEIVKEVSRMLQRIVGEDIQLETRLAQDLWNVRADPTAIDQVLINLAINARDAMESGGNLLIETYNAQLDIDYAQERGDTVPAGEYAVIAVSDEGTGIDTDTRRRIFEPFFTTKGPGIGTGLGLSTCYGIVKQANGHIWVYSEVGRGSTFKVYLPRVSGETAPTASAQTISPDLRGEETVLVAEDDEQVRRLTVRALTKHGYTVLQAATGDEAIAIAERHPGRIHLLLTDVVMPKMSGSDLVRRLTAVYPDTRILYMSGYTANAIVQHGELQEGVLLLQKPFTELRLVSKVREALDS